jgi:hypothetical protein
MATTITVKPNQSMQDVVVQACGSMEAADQFCEDNGVSITDIPAVGTIYTVSDASLAAAGNVGAGVLQSYKKNGTVVGTLGNNPPCDPPTVAPVDFTSGGHTISEGDTMTLVCATGGGVWSSSDAGVATVDGDGLVTTVAAGDVTISYTVTRDCGSSASSTFDITVDAAPPVGMTMVLNPRLNWNLTSGTPPATLTYYPLRLQARPGGAGVGFEHVNTLNTGWPGSVTAGSSKETDWLLSGSILTQAELSGNPQTAINLNWHIDYYDPAHPAIMMVFFDVEGTSLTVDPLKFKDILGNTAYAAPLICLDTTSQAILSPSPLIADIIVELVSSTSTHATLRITRSHPTFPTSGPLNDFKSYVMKWTDDALGGTPDPLDPTNDNKTIVTVPIGTYNFGVNATYTNTGLSIDYPKSRITCCVEVS